ncbi:hypothetical protein SAMN05216388_104119 [Halorientalis persicus]|uniref:Uncharacterized protein n=1 Tax=Halorientalis persicus TaxID=1367881 RepID=A0A1H8VSE8_9EURY|nr:hypothetical protein SAMN05216388_104119 [Halorientalis persicus]
MAIVPDLGRCDGQWSERLMGDVDLDVVKTQLAQSYTRALQPAAREHIHTALLELDVEVPQRVRQRHRGSQQYSSISIWFANGPHNFVGSISLVCWKYV